MTSGVDTCLELDLHEGGKLLALLQLCCSSLQFVSHPMQVLRLLRQLTGQRGEAVLMLLVLGVPLGFHLLPTSLSTTGGAGADRERKERAALKGRAKQPRVEA